MQINDIVTNLEISKKLYDLGVFQNSLFGWYKPDNKEKWVVCDHTTEYAAFMAHELLEIFPKEIKIYHESVIPYHSCELRISAPNLKNNKFVINIGYDTYEGFYTELDMEDINLCNALAKMLINLIENGVVEV